MATLVLQAAGSAVGSLFGPVGEMVGRAAGAIAGNLVDRSLFGAGARRIVGPRLQEMGGLAASEGGAVSRIYGRARVGGQLIWATRFEEEMVTTVRKAQGGKGGASQRTREQTYSYFANLAIALAEGEISLVRRVFADGREIDLQPLNHRIYRGTQTQEPDPLITAKEGPGNAPAYRGIAYVVFERLPLAPFGNRVPQFSFEVVRALPGLRERIRSVNLIPGSSEFAYAVNRVTRVGVFGAATPENRAQLQGESDVIASLDQLQSLCPALHSVNLVVSWFGDDLRAGNCTIAPRVDQVSKVTEGMEWRVAGLSRAQARAVTSIDGRPAYGGTPADASVIALIRELKARGLKVNLYPFIMMDVPPGNSLPNPYGGVGQGAFPWRGRVTCSPAPGQPGTVDASVAGANQIAGFVGTVAAADVTSVGEAVVCAKPDEWSFRRHILHYARLAQIAGGVDGFIIGSEMVGLTRVRSAPGAYPFVTALVGLSDAAREILGPGTRITYASDWTEYGAHVLQGGQEVRFPLDPLWAAANIDAVGIDYYAPISDWRDGDSHLDAAAARSGVALDYLAARQRSGEAFDWFYADSASRLAQTRLPISDGAFAKPWVFRSKDLAGWWLNSHRERVAGAELPAPTAWQPGLKPIWLTEIGCPAVDKGANQPNIFPDLRSIEGGVPAFSSGERDDLMQHRALVAQIGVFDPASSLFQPAANPLRPGGPTRMIDPRDVSVWAWDARPFPAFPARLDIWSDGVNWRTGHWLNGRLENAPLDQLVAAILRDYGLPAASSLAVDQLIDGYVLDRPMSAREALEPLAAMFGLDAVFSATGLKVTEPAAANAPLIADDRLVPDRKGKPWTLTRSQETELPRELRLSFIDGDFDYRRGAARSRRLASIARREVSLEAPAVMQAAQAEKLAEMRLRDSWISREGISVALSPRELALEPGDHIRLTVDGAARLFRITSVTDGETRQVMAVRAEANRAPTRVPDAPARPGVVRVQPTRPFGMIIELPAATGADTPLHYLAARVDPWAGPLLVSRDGGDGRFTPIGEVTRPALFGRTLTSLPAGPLWRWDTRAGVEVELAGGALQSITDLQALSGVNSFALLGADGHWEILTARNAELIGPGRYRLSRLLRGLSGSEAAAGRQTPAGATLVALDEALLPLTSSIADIGRTLRYRVTPPGIVEADPAILTLTASLEGLALRPLSPVHPRARRVAGSIHLNWRRRARHDGDSWGLADPPLAEGSERYEVAIYAGGVLRRRLEVATTQAIYASADELADFGSAQSALSLGVTQISSAVGPGAQMRQLVPVLP